MSVDRLGVKATTDIGAIYGTDGLEYDLHEGETIAIPAATAAPLLDQDAVEVLDDRPPSPREARADTQEPHTLMSTSSTRRSTSSPQRRQRWVQGRRRWVRCSPDTKADDVVGDQSPISIRHLAESVSTMMRPTPLSVTSAVPS